MVTGHGVQLWHCNNGKTIPVKIRTNQFDFYPEIFGIRNIKKKIHLNTDNCLI